MNISEVITKLSELREEYGDIPVRALPGLEGEGFWNLSETPWHLDRPITVEHQGTPYASVHIIGNDP
jgi:hypothetical protein